MAMSWEAREALRHRNQMRHITCRRCGAMGTREVDGSTLGDGGFPGLLYRVCGGCGYVYPLKKPTPKPRKEGT